MRGNIKKVEIKGFIKVNKIPNTKFVAISCRYDKILKLEIFRNHEKAAMSSESPDIKVVPIKIIVK